MAEHLTRNRSKIHSCMLGEMIIRFRWGLIAILVVGLAWAGPLIPGIEIDQNFDKYFPDEDPDLGFYRSMVSELGDEDDLLMLAVHREKGIFDSVFLEKFHAFTLAAAQLPYVVDALSITNLIDVKRTPFGNLPSPFIHLSDPIFYTSDSIRLSEDERLPERFVSRDLKTLTVLLELEKQLDGKTSEALISSVESLGREFEFSEMYILGKSYFEVIHNRTSRKELKKGVLIGIGLIIALLGFLYRSFWGIIIPVLVYACSILVFLEYLAIRGHSLDILMNLAPTILLAVSVSDVIHFLSKYEDQIKAGLGKREALKTSLNDIGLALFLTSFTTAIGFLTLLTSDLPILRKFGEDIAVGVLLAFMVTVVLVPFVLYHVSEHAIHIRTDWYQWWRRTAGWIFHAISNRPQWITRGAIFLTLAGLLILPQINTNNFLLASLPKNHPSMQGVKFYEKNLGGIRTFEIALIPKKGALLNQLALLKEIEKLHRHLDSLPAIGGVFSPVTFYKSLNKAWHGGRNSAFILPDSQESIDRLDQYFKPSSAAIFRRILNKEKSFGKISAKMNDLGRKKVNGFNREMAGWIAANIDPSILETRIIGASAMADKIQEHSIRNMFSGLAFALLAVGVLVFLLCRNWRLVMIAMAINVLPLIITGAVMALSGVELRCITSIIFTVGFVIAVDDTIHFIGRYQLERFKGLSNQDSIFITLQETGRAILLTSVVLFFGFAQLIASSFRDAKAVGILVGVMLVFSLAADLFLGPALIFKLPRPSQR